MKTSRLIVSLIGLVAIVLTYYTGNLYYLIIAVAAFFAGLYMMGANRRPAETKKTKGERDVDSRKKNAKRN